MKRIFVLLLAWGIFFSLWTAWPAAAADGIRIEATDFASKNCSVRTADDRIELQETYQGGKTYTLTYTVDVPEAGMYAMTVASTKLNFGYTADYKVQINQEEPFSATDAVLIGEYPGISVMGIHDLGPVKLNQGKNTVTFLADQKNALNEQVTFYLAYFEFTKAAWGVRSLEPLAPVGVFQESENVRLSVAYNGTPEDHQLRFKVTDFWAATVLEGTFTARQNSTGDTINLGRLQRGWYKVELFEGEEELVFTQDKWEDYAKALRLAGINWIRERLSWSESNPEPGTYSYGNYLKSSEVLAQQGINILTTYHDSPLWTRESGNRMLPEDLFDTYNFNRRLADDIDEVDVWEMWNEEDVTILFLTETADAYAAHFKAAAIALSDTEQNPYVSFGGFSQNATQTDFIDLVMQNGIMDYTDLYNYHNHSTFDDLRANQSIDLNFAQSEAQMETVWAYDSENKPVWVTEAGMKLPVEDGEIAPKQDLLNTQARYVVQSNVEALSMGNTKNFWFVFPKYIENGGDFGTFYEFHTPYPAYQAEAVMTYVLGDGIYKGTVAGLNAGTRGHVIDNGNADVAVLWSDSPDVVEFSSSDPALLTDLMGLERTIEPVDGKISVRVGIDPVFITFSGRMNEGDLIPRQYQERTLEKGSFTKAQRVVLNQTFEGIDFYEGKQYGYRKDKNQPFEMQVEVYNFNDVEMTGTVRGSAECELTFTPSEQTVTIPSMSKQTVTFTMQAGASAEYDRKYDLMFTAEFDGEQSSPTVSHISFKRTEPLDGVLLPGADDPAMWDDTNVISNTESYVRAGEEPGEIVIGADMYQAGSWYYPQLPVDGTSIADTDGIAFWLKADQDVPYKEPEFIDAFIYCDDGSQYFLGVKPIAFVDDWRYFYITWDNWVFNKEGTRGTRTLDPSTIVELGIGFNTTRPTEITVKEITAFRLPEPIGTDEREIVFEGVRDGEQLSVPPQVTVRLPEGIIPEDTRVLLNGNERGATVQDGLLHIDLTGLAAGEYTLAVVAYTETGLAIDGNVSFRIG